jgi:predicted nucleic acid-binding protein
MRAASSVLLLQTLADFSNVAIRKERIAAKDIRRTIDAWRGVCEPYSRSLARQYFLATATRLSQRGLYCAFC